MWSILMVIAGAAAAPAGDQTRDAAVVVNFLSAVASDDRSAQRRYLARQTFIGEPMHRSSRSLQDFQSHARGCVLSTVKIVNSDKPLPIGVTWKCPYPKIDQQASFWVQRGTIVRIAFGQSPLIRPGPPR